MGYCELIPFKDGAPISGVEFRNPWGGASRIWDALFKAYIPKKGEYDSFLNSAIKDSRLWDLAKRRDLPTFERAVHLFTFDNFYVKNSNLSRMAADLRSFAEKYPTGECVDHLPAWSRWMEENGTAEAVGLYATSVGNNLWYRRKKCPHCGSEMDESEAVPLSEGTEVYEWVDFSNNL